MEQQHIIYKTNNEPSRLSTPMTTAVTLLPQFEEEPAFSRITSNCFVIGLVM
ncbi:MAG: hypothetical protein KKC76_06145 [Proteobacteria bacterium]|nr:hypothetical protein [Pseudomonadota bacterium]MBU4297601.1 hypothetical protein [Pseudomonadota bacterium]MCG2750036.1 hypothetical protein [Desulfobulbaceae bacterium]